MSDETAGFIWGFVACLIVVMLFFTMSLVSDLEVDGPFLERSNNRIEQSALTDKYFEQQRNHLLSNLLSIFTINCIANGGDVEPIPNKESEFAQLTGLQYDCVGENNGS